MKKKTLYLIFIVMMMWIFCTGCGNSIEEFVYETVGDHIIITGYQGEAVDVKIPSRIEGKPVTEIGKSAFWHQFDIVEITIPKTVAIINEYAFMNCNSLKKINIPNGVTRIGEKAFEQCSSLEEIIIPGSVEIIGNSAFALCKSLSSVIFEDGITEIGEYCFLYCSSISEIELPNSVKIIHPNAFLSCESLEKVILREGVQKIGTSAFACCISLEKIEIPLSVQEIDDSAFGECTSLEKVILPENLKQLNSNIFHDCTQLKEIKIPNQMECIYFSAFNGCTGLEKIELPISLKTIETNAFYGCDSLVEVIYAGSSKEWENIYVASGNYPLFSVTYESVESTVSVNDIDDGKEIFVKVYIDNAQKLIDSGEYEVARVILEEGIKSTNDSTLADMLSEVLVQQSVLQEKTVEENTKDLNEVSDVLSTESDDGDIASDITLEKIDDENNMPPELLKGSIVDYWDYTGIWATQGFGWEIGGVMLDIVIENDQMGIGCRVVQAYSQSRVSVIEKWDITIEDIIDNTISIDFDDDGWGNKGTLQVKFADNSVAKTIECTILNLEYVGDTVPVWGDYDGQYILALNNEAYQLLVVPEVNKYDESNIVYEEAYVEYDTSKASGILAMLGMTESDFKESSIALQDEYVVPVWETLDMLLEYPSDYIGIFCNLMAYDVIQKGISNDGYLYYVTNIGHEYQNYNIIVFDYRDDVYAPTISVDDVIKMYGIYQGIMMDDFGKDYLVFALITCEKR